MASGGGEVLKFPLLNKNFSPLTNLKTINEMSDSEILQWIFAHLSSLRYGGEALYIDYINEDGYHVKKTFVYKPEHKGQPDLDFFREIIKELTNT